LLPPLRTATKSTSAADLSHAAADAAAAIAPRQYHSWPQQVRSVCTPRADDARLVLLLLLPQDCSKSSSCFAGAGASGRGVTYGSGPAEGCGTAIADASSSCGQGILCGGGRAPAACVAGDAGEARESSTLSLCPAIALAFRLRVSLGPLTVAASAGFASAPPPAAAWPGSGAIAGPDEAATSSLATAGGSSAASSSAAGSLTLASLKKLSAVANAMDWSTATCSRPGATADTGHRPAVSAQTWLAIPRHRQHTLPRGHRPCSLGGTNNKPTKGNAGARM
jgi:hypothetical protein